MGWRAGQGRECTEEGLGWEKFEGEKKERETGDLCVFCFHLKLDSDQNVFKFSPDETHLFTCVAGALSSFSF